MKSIQCNEKLPGKLRKLRHPTEVHHFDGRVIGQFFPTCERYKYEIRRLECDERLPRKLLELENIVEICDANGKTIGHFHPKLDPNKYDLEPQISEEEIERRSKSNEPTYTTAEVLAYLEKLK